MYDWGLAGVRGELKGLEDPCLPNNLPDKCLAVKKVQRLFEVVNGGGLLSACLACLLCLND